MASLFEQLGFRRLPARRDKLYEQGKPLLLFAINRWLLQSLFLILKHYCPRKNLLKNLENTLFYHYLIFGHENAVSEKAVHFFQNN